MPYPKQLITSLCNQLQDTLTDFFNVEQRKYFSEYTDINSMVSDTLREFIKDEAELGSVHSQQVKNRRQKRNRWITAYKNAMLEHSITDKSHPLHFIQQDFDNMNARSFIKLYDAHSVDEAVAMYESQMDKWASNDRSLLIDYPLIMTKTKNQVVSSFQIDLIINLITIVMTSYDGNIDSYFSKKPTLLIDNPVFSPNKFTVPLKASLDSYVADLVDFDRDNTVFQMFINHSSDSSEELQKVRVFDQKDNQILMTLINNISLDFYESRQIAIDVGTIAKSINNRPNKHLYEDVKSRLHNMALINFRICEKDTPNKPIYTFSFIDEVLNQQRDNKEYVVVTFGHALYEAITKKKMISVTSSNYNSLTLDMSKLLYHNLQKERIALSASVEPDADGYLHKTYDYSYFQRVILFKRKKKADNILLIKDTLDEFVSRGIALAKYTYDPERGQFHLYYFRLSNDEKADLMSMNENSDGLLEFLGSEQIEPLS